jgi:acyl-CoA thioester hydrolase
MSATGRFAITVRVYYEDTDAGGIVYHAGYLRFMERARTEWLRTLGVGHRALAGNDGLQFVVTELSIRFMRPALLDDLLCVDLGVSSVRRASMELSQRILREADGEVLAEATVRVAALDRGTLRPAPLPRSLLASLEKA